ncbi:MAG: hypothetical protein F6K40_18420 [Okeania sp. SIO3I5]|uniref:hypothetical protein n=1 Tax=Okeania sp. SIO3I5 TaxID=2607805 RepID=UPI0013BD1FB7|nr:hypothetical protein [Okeania sp. SIO3I5]NEQ38131.1 hypothetical protein [Okeania sp. SIO3I5]
MVKSIEAVVRRRWLSPENAVREVVRFERCFGDKHLKLACHCGLFLILTPELVNLIRINFLDEENIDWIAESNFLLSSLCRPLQERIYEVEPCVREVLLVELENNFDWERPFELAEFLWFYLDKKTDKKLSGDLRMTQKWIAQAYLAPDSTIREMGRLLSESLPKDNQDLGLGGEEKVPYLVEILAEPLEQTNLWREYQILVLNSHVLAKLLVDERERLREEIEEFKKELGDREEVELGNEKFVLIHPVIEKLLGEFLSEDENNNSVETIPKEKLDLSLEVSTPTEKTRQIVTERRSITPNKKIYNRKVYMLIDQSGSMARRDVLFDTERRWKAMAEVVEGHVYRILNKEGINGEKICDEITVTFFSPNRPSTVIYPILDDSQVPALFEENQPDSNTFLVPTFEKIVGQWFNTRMPNEGGFIIIYTDGALDDRDTFVRCVEETCYKLNSQDELKVVIIGLGSDVDRDPNFYLRLSANANSFRDKNSKLCNIVVFDLLNKMSSIIDLLNRQLEYPKADLPIWGKKFCPELYD